MSPRPARRGTLSRGVVRVGRERRLRPGSREPRAREAKADSGVPRVSEDHRRLIRPPRTTAGLPWRAGSGSGDGRTRPTSPGLKPRARPGSGAETRPPTSRGGLGLKNAERAGAIRTRRARVRPERAAPERTAGTPKGSKIKI